MKSKSVNMSEKSRSAILNILFVIVWIFIWEAISIYVGQELLVPSVFVVTSKLVSLVMTPLFWQIALMSIFRITVGFVAGTVIGVALAILTSFSKITYAFFRPVLSIIKATPIVSFIILTLVWIKGGNIPAFISFLMVFPIVLGNVFKGIEQTDRKFLEMAKVYRLPKTLIFGKIYFNSILPYLGAAATTSMGLAWKAGIAAEVLATPRFSIGTAIYNSKIYLETADLFAWSIVVIILSVILEKIIEAILGRLTPGYKKPYEEVADAKVSSAEINEEFAKKTYYPAKETTTANVPNATTTDTTYEDKTANAANKAYEAATINAANNTNAVTASNAPNATNATNATTTTYATNAVNEADLDVFDSLQTSKAHIIIDHITLEYDGTIIMKNFNETLPDRGCVCFFGVSGVGKTTLLDTIAGLKKPATGSVCSLDSKGERDAIPRLAYVFQEDRLLPWLDAIDNVRLVLHTISKKEARETAFKYLEMTGLEDAIQKFPAELSGGMKQRVNIARALSFDAKILLLDEPFKGLDTEMKLHIINLLNEYKKTGLILLVTHDKMDIEALADRVVELHKIEK